MCLWFSFVLKTLRNLLLQKSSYALSFVCKTKRTFYILQLLNKKIINNFEECNTCSNICNHNKDKVSRLLQVYR